MKYFQVFKYFEKYYQTTERTRRTLKPLPLSDPFISLTSFDARTRPEPTDKPSLELCFFLAALAVYNFLLGVQMGQAVKKIDTEVEPVWLLELIQVGVISFSSSSVFVTRRANLSVRALFGWIVLLSSLNLLGAILGVSLPLLSGCVRSVLYQGMAETSTITSELY